MRQSKQPSGEFSALHGIEVDKTSDMGVVHQRQGGLTGQVFDTLIVDTVVEHGYFVIIVTIDIHLRSIEA